MKDTLETEINKIILEYFINKKYTQTYQTFLSESGLKKEDAVSGNVLIKKWNEMAILNREKKECDDKIKQLQEQIEKGINNLNQPINQIEVHTGLPKSMPLSTLTGHSGEVTSLSFHPLYRRLVSGSEDATLRIWDCDDYQIEKNIKAHTDTINCIAFDITGNIIASASKDMLIKLWNYESGILIKLLKGHEHSVTYIVFTNDSKNLYSCSRDSTIRYWDVNKGSCIKTVNTDNCWFKCLSLNSDCSLLASCDKSNNITIWQTETMTKLNELVGHSDNIQKVLFVNNKLCKDNFVASDYVTAFYSKSDNNNNDVNSNINSNSNNNGISNNIKEQIELKRKLMELKKELIKNEYLLSCSGDNKIILWDVLKALCIKEFCGHSNWVKDICLHSNGNYFISCSDDRSIIVWDIKTGEIVKKLINSHQKFVNCLSFSPKCKIMASGSNDYNIKIWECN